MSKFNVGDKVRVRKDLVVDKKYGTQVFVDGMMELRGKIVTIKCVTDSFYRVEEDEKIYPYNWTDEMLEPVITNWDKVKEEVMKLKVEDFCTYCICDAIDKVRGEKKCRDIKCCDCEEWLKQPYQEPSILDDVEKEYLRAVIKPFRDKVTYVALLGYDERKIYIRIKTQNDPAGICFPNFKKGTMYKGMKLGKKYTLEELDL